MGGKVASGNDDAKRVLLRIKQKLGVGTRTQGALPLSPCTQLPKYTHLVT